MSDAIFIAAVLFLAGVAFLLGLFLRDLARFVHTDRQRTALYRENRRIGIARRG